MIYKLLSVSKSPQIEGVNIGDYIQALASCQYYPQLNGFLDRDVDLKTYDGEPCNMIMNGWYMHEPFNWPPSDKINPLFVAFHVNSVAKDILLSSESLEYLKKYQPIGCRDLGTMKLLESHDIKAYFSGCMTLTLGKKYHSEIKEDKTYIVDPIFNGKLNTGNIFRALYEMLIHPFDIFKLYRTEQLCLHHGRNFIKKLFKTSLYYREYTKVFGRRLVMESTYVCQEHRFYQQDFHTEEERLKEAERLVKMYARAKLVITSRIHCALPCLGIETPVIYLEKANDSETSYCRLDGLKDLFNIVKVDNGTLVPQYKTSIPISVENPPINKESWKVCANILEQKCSDFIRNESL